jgi:hypothetical protein
MPSGTMDEFLTWCSAREERLAEIAELAYRAAATPEKSKLLRVLLAEMNSHSRMVAGFALLRLSTREPVVHTTSSPHLLISGRSIRATSNSTRGRPLSNLPPVAPEVEDSNLFWRKSDKGLQRIFGLDGQTLGSRRFHALRSSPPDTHCNCSRSRLRRGRGCPPAR